jgi:hypothetical protein
MSSRVESTVYYIHKLGYQVEHTNLIADDALSFH